MKRILILLTFLCAFIMTTSVLAYTPPFSSGRISSPYGAVRKTHIHAGVDVDGMPGNTYIFLLPSTAQLSMGQEMVFTIGSGFGEKGIPMPISLATLTRKH